MRSRAPSPTRSVLRTVLAPALGLAVCALPALAEPSPLTPCAESGKQHAPAPPPGESAIVPGQQPFHPPPTPRPGPPPPDAGAQLRPPGAPPHRPGTQVHRPGMRRVNVGFAPSEKSAESSPPATAAERAGARRSARQGSSETPAGCAGALRRRGPR